MTEENIERVARALCGTSGDDPDGKTYAHATHCTGRETAPEFKWMYWVKFAKASITACERSAPDDLRKRNNELLAALKQIKIVCIDNAATTVRHDLALEFVGGIADRALSLSSHHNQTGAE